MNNKPSFRIPVLVNNAHWKDMKSRLDYLTKWFSPKVDIQFVPTEVAITPLPFELWSPNTYGINLDFLQKVLGPYIDGGVGGIFLTNSSEWRGGMLNGATDINRRPLTIQTHADESEVLYNRSDIPALENLLTHELMHFFYAITGQKDMTHTWDGALLVQCLADLDFSTKPSQIQIIKTTLAGLYNQLKILMGKVNDLEILEHAMILVESADATHPDGNDNAEGDKGLINHAYGCLQIRKGAVTDVNQVWGTSYQPQDFLNNRPLSIKALETYWNRYATEKRIGRPVTNEDRARIWNGGPNAWVKPQADAVKEGKLQKYVNDVNAAISRLKNV